MGLNIKNPEVERLAAEAAKRYGETKTEAIRVALEERLRRRTPVTAKEEKGRRMRYVLEKLIWPSMPPEVLGKSISKQEIEEILGYGPHGV